MALNQDTLGQSIYNALDSFNDKDLAAIGNKEAARLAFCKALAGAVIDHIKTFAEVPALGLVAPGGSGGPVTGRAAIV